MLLDAIFLNLRGGVSRGQRSQQQMGQPVSVVPDDASEAPCAVLLQEGATGFRIVMNCHLKEFINTF